MLLIIFKIKKLYLELLTFSIAYLFSLLVERFEKQKALSESLGNLRGSGAPLKKN